MVFFFVSVAFERKLDEVNALIGATVYSVGHVVFFKRDRNLLNLIIIPVSIILTLLLIGITFFLRHLRFVNSKYSIDLFFSI